MKRTFAAIALICLTCLSSPGFAVPVAFQYSGTILSKFGPATTDFSVGDTVTANFAYDPAPVSFFLQNATTLGFFENNSYSVFINGNPYASGSFLEYDVGSNGSTFGVTGINNIFNFIINGLPGSSSPPTTPLVDDILATQGALTLHSLDGQSFGVASRTLLVLDTPVPEPLTIAVFGAGLVGAAAMRRRRKTN